MTGNQATKKLHHYVPQAYLRGFANENERLTAQKLPGDSEPFTTIVKNVGAQTHFHRVEGLGRPDEFEDILAGIEGDAQTVIRKLVAGRALPLSSEDRSTLAFFIALQAVRGPDTRRTSEMIQRQLVRLEVGAGGRKNVQAWIKKNMGIDATPDQEERIWTTATQPGGPPITFNNFVHIKNMMEMAQEIVPTILGRPWTLHTFTNRSLITSDSPVALIYKDDPEDGYGVGFKTAWGISFPLTHKLGLLMSDPTVMLEDFEVDDPRIHQVGDAVRAGKVDSEQVGTTAIEKFFNHHTAWNAREYIYYHPDGLRFVPVELPDPQLVNIAMSGGNMEFTGEPLFGSTKPPAVP